VSFALVSYQQVVNLQMHVCVGHLAFGVKMQWFTSLGHELMLNQSISAKQMHFAVHLHLHMLAYFFFNSNYWSVRMFWCTLCIDWSSAVHTPRKMTEKSHMTVKFCERSLTYLGNNLIYLIGMQGTVFNKALLRSINIRAAFSVIKKLKFHSRWSAPCPGCYTAENNLVLLVQEAAWAPGQSGRVRGNLPSPGFYPHTVQSVASRYADYATWVPSHESLVIIKSHQIFSFKQT
jgi:hypothetical protein